MTDWGHNALAADLLDHRHLAGEIAIERLAVCGGQLDVAAMRLSWSQPRLTGYEVKISRADFLRDVRANKWRRYLTSIERLIFAFPAGLVDAREVPTECGVIYRGERGWWTKRAAPVRPIADARHAGFVQALLFRHYPVEWDGNARMRRLVHFAAGKPCPACRRAGEHEVWCLYAPVASERSKNVADREGIKTA